MKRIFLDTNILLDVFLERHPFCTSAQQVWTLVENKRLHAAISAISVMNIFFIMRKLTSVAKAHQAVRALIESFTIIETSARLISRALRSEISDLEDAVQYYSALKSGSMAIITRDPHGFKTSLIPVFDCAQYLVYLEKR